MFHEDLLAECKKRILRSDGRVGKSVLGPVQHRWCDKMPQACNRLFVQSKLYCKCDTGCLSQVNCIVNGMQIM